MNEAEFEKCFHPVRRLNDAALNVLRNYEFEHGRAPITSIFENRKFSLADIAAIPTEVRHALAWNCACLVRMDELYLERRKGELFPHQVVEIQRGINAFRRQFELSMRLLNF